MAYGERTSSNVNGIGTAYIKLEGSPLIVLEHMSSASHQTCIVEVLMTIKKIGNTGTCRLTGRIHYGTLTSSTASKLKAINTTIDNLLSLEFFSSTTSNPYVFYNGVVEQLN
jgi:hypothetical protein